MKTILGMAALAALAAGAAHAQSFGPESLITEVGLTAAPGCPDGTLEADGRTLEINDEAAVFSLLGVTYGGDGTTDFKLPDLRDAVPLAGMHYCFVMRGEWPARP